MTATELQLIAIRTDGDTQARVAIDDVLAHSYGEAMRDGAEFPPVDVFYDGTDYWCADGFHRVIGAMAFGFPTIAARVHQGAQSDAAWFACAANAKHGLYRSNADKRRAVEMALRHPNGAKLSNAQIAHHCGVSDKTVADVRHRMESTSEVPKSTERVGRDGRTINVDAIGPRAETSREPVESDEPLEHKPKAQRAPSLAQDIPVEAEAAFDHPAAVVRLLRLVRDERKRWPRAMLADFAAVLRELVAETEEAEAAA